MADEIDEKEEGAEEAAGGEGQDVEKKRSRKKLLVIVIVLVVDILLMAGVAFAIVKAVKGEDPAVTAMREEEMAAQKQQEMVTQMGNTLEAPYKITVNIASNDGETHFLKCEVQLEWDGLTHINLAGELEKRQPKIKDIIIKILSAQSMAGLMSIEGKENIRHSLVTDINSILPVESGRIRSAYFTEFLIQ